MKSTNTSSLALAHDRDRELVFEKWLTLVLGLPLFIQVPGESGSERSLGIGGLTAADRVEPYSILRTRHRLEQDIPQIFPEIDFLEIGVFGRKSPHPQELDQLAISGQDRFIVIVAGVGNEIRGEHLLLVEADGFRHVEGELDHRRGRSCSRSKSLDSGISETAP